MVQCAMRSKSQLQASKNEAARKELNEMLS